MTKRKDKKEMALVNKSKIYKDGKEIKVRAYTINGNNYFKLRDLAQVFDLGVDWIGLPRFVDIDTGGGRLLPSTQDVFKQSVMDAGLAVINIIKEKDMEGLSAYVHPKTLMQ